MGWTVRGSNAGGGEIFRTRPDRPWGPPSLLYNGYRVFPGAKAAGVWHWPPTPSSAEIKERVELFLYTTCGPSSPVLGWTLPLSLLHKYTFFIIYRSFLLMMEMFQTEIVEKIKTHILRSVTFFFEKLYCLWGNVEKYCRVGQAADGNMAHAHCMLGT